MRLSLSILACNLCSVDCRSFVGTPLVLRINLDKLIIPPSGFFVKPIGKIGDGMVEKLPRTV